MSSPLKVVLPVCPPHTPVDYILLSPWREEGMMKIPVWSLIFKALLCTHSFYPET